MPSTPGETNVPVSDWTTGTLKILQDQNVANIKELLESEICAIRKTIKESDRRYEQRFDGQEKATGLAIQSAKEAVIKAENATERRFESVNEFRAALNDASKEQISRPEYVSAHQSLIDKIDELNNRMNRSEGVDKGSQLQMGKIYAAIAAVGGILAIVVLLANGLFK